MESTNNHKRIAKNTVMLYFRMLFTMFVGLFTSRVILERLGINDFGIYNVVGGAIAMFGIVSGSMTSAVSRFLTFELGRQDIVRLRNIFYCSVIIQFALAIIVFVLIEIIGVWFVNHKMVIAPERLSAANWVLQCSAVTFIINMISVPYNAVIVAHEKMQAYAYISIIEVILKLTVAYLLYLTIFDSLKTYAVLSMISALAVRWIYTFYCKKNFEESRLNGEFKIDIIKEISSYSGWNFIGSSSSILRDQGVNILLNLFCGTAVNAARGIAIQVNHAVYNFSSNFMMAVNPRIIKLYAVGERKQMFSLVKESSKFSFFLLLILSLPILFCTSTILNLWLTVVPNYASIFTKLTLILGMSEALGIPLQFVNQATGRIKKYQIVVGGIQLLNFPLSYILLNMGLSPVSVYYCAITISQSCMFARLLMLRHSVGLNIKDYIYSVYLPVLSVAICTALPIYFISKIIESNVQPYLSSILIILLCLVDSIATVWLIGCSNQERKQIKSIVLSKLHKNSK